MSDESKISKKVVLVSPLPPPIGGIASWTESFLSYLNTHNMSYKHVNSAVIGKRIHNKKTLYIEELRRMFKLRCKIKSAIKNESNVVVHYNASCFTQGLIRDLFVLLGIKAPIVYQCHCNLDTNISNKVSRFFFSLICHKVSAVCVLNNASKKTAEIYSRNVFYVPNFVDKLSCDHKEISEQLNKVCFVGRVERKKGIHELISAATKFPNIEFDIIGPITDVDFKDINVPNVKLWGPVENCKIYEILKKMDAYVLPSYSEGFPLGVLEAMSCGLPIIASDVGSIKDMISEYGGILVRPYSVEDLIDSFNKISSKDIRMKMSEYNIEKVKNHYLIDVVVKQFFEIYSSL